jgi:peptide methionine sulfoxide reductase MsrB
VRLFDTKTLVETYTRTELGADISESEIGTQIDDQSANMDLDGYAINCSALLFEKRQEE